MKNNYLAKQTRQFKGLCKQIGKSWSVLSQQEQGSLLARFRRLYGSLKTAFARPQLRKMMGAAAFVLVAGAAQGQRFAAPVKNPFGLEGIGSYASPVFIDIDNDGDLDFFSGHENGKVYQRVNLGSATTPNFGGLSSIWGIQSNRNFVGRLAFVDWGADDDLDLLIGDVNGNFFYHENTVNVPSSSSTINPYGLTDIGTWASPTFVDIDNDGDLDLFSGRGSGSFAFFQNIGSDSVPAFDTLVTNPFNLVNIIGQNNLESTPVFVDIDNDGDLDLFSGAQRIQTAVVFYENIGSDTAANFGAPVINPFGITAPLTGANNSYPTFVDIDNDGDQDLFIGGNPGFVFFYENEEITSTTKLQSSTSFTLSPNPVSKELLLQFEELNNYHIRVMDLRGQVIESYFIQQDNSLQLPTQAWPTGLYLLEVRDEKGGVTTKKIVKK